MNFEVGTQQVDDGKIGCRPAVRHRAGLEHIRALQPVIAGELRKQARFANAWLADEGHHLAMAAARLLPYMDKRIELECTADKVRHAAVRLAEAHRCL